MTSPWEAFESLARAVGGMFVVLMAWAWLQSVVRRNSGCRRPDKDVLEFMVHGCGGCAGKGNGSCHSKSEGER